MATSLARASGSRVGSVVSGVLGSRGRPTRSMATVTPMTMMETMRTTRTMTTMTTMKSMSLPSRRISFAVAQSYGWLGHTRSLGSSPICKASTGKTARPLSPAVLNLINKHGLDASMIPATGPKGHILKGDVLAHLDGEPVITTTTKPTGAGLDTVVSEDATATYTDIPASNIRKVIAKRLTESKATIPHAYAQVEVDMSSLVSLRKHSIEELGVKFSFNDAIIKSAALALRTMPDVNASFSNGEVEKLNTVDISVAVATPTGLITPIVTGADGRGVVDISNTIKELAGRAREGKLQPHEYQGGTFSVSNLGMMGISSFSAVINPPQACILAVGATRPKITGDFKVKQFATFTLSSDARVCDDEMASKWLAKFKTFMENPATLL